MKHAGSKYRMVSLALFLILFMAGCATQGVNTAHHSDNPMIRVDNEIVVPKPPSETWDMLVKELSKSFYIINNIDKESRIINISFVSTDPADYIDCGHTVRTYTHNDKTETYAYDTAASSTYKMATTVQPNANFTYYAQVRRDTSLEGRSNIYVAPHTTMQNSTVVTVNTRYIWTLKMQGQVFVQALNGNIIHSERLPDESNIITFNTNQTGQNKKSATMEQITCFSKGTLEREILGMVKH